MPLTRSGPTFSELAALDQARLARLSSEAMAEVAAGLKEELRAATRAAGLGDRLANAWRSEVFPRGGPSLEPAAYVYSRAPKLMDVFTRGATIYPLAGRRYLAIPTANVPNATGGRRGQKMTPLDVEVSFNQDLIIRRGRNGHLLAFVNAVQGANRRGFKPATRGRLAAGREVRLVLMFTLVKQAVIRRKFDGQAIADSWSAKAAELLQRRLG